MEKMLKFDGRNVDECGDSSDNKIAAVLGDIRVVNYLLQNENWSDLLGINPPKSICMKRKRVSELEFTKPDTYLNYLHKLAKFSKQIQSPMHCYSSRNFGSLSVATTNKINIESKSSNTIESGNASKTVNRIDIKDSNDGGNSSNSEMSSDNDSNNSNYGSGSDSDDENDDSSKSASENIVESQGRLATTRINQRANTIREPNVNIEMNFRSLSDSSTDDENYKDKNGQIAKTVFYGSRTNCCTMELRELNLSLSSSCSDIESKNEQKKKNHASKKETDKHKIKSHSQDRDESTRVEKRALQRCCSRSCSSSSSSSTSSDSSSSSCSSSSSDNETKINEQIVGTINNIPNCFHESEKHAHLCCDENQKNINDTSLSGLSSLDSYSEQIEGGGTAYKKHNFNGERFSSRSSSNRPTTREKERQVQSRKNYTGPATKQITTRSGGLRVQDTKIKTREFIEDSRSSSTSSIQKESTQSLWKKQTLGTSRRFNKSHSNKNGDDDDDDVEKNCEKMSANKQKILQKLIAQCKTKEKERAFKGSILINNFNGNNNNGTKKKLKNKSVLPNAAHFKRNTTKSGINIQINMDCHLTNNPPMNRTIRQRYKKEEILNRKHCTKNHCKNSGKEMTQKAKNYFLSNNSETEEYRKIKKSSEEPHKIKDELFLFGQKKTMLKTDVLPVEDKHQKQSSETIGNHFHHHHHHHHH